MVGRSLLSFLATAAVTIASCAAQPDFPWLFPPGRYEITRGQDGIPITALGDTPGASVILLPGPEKQVWDVKRVNVPFAPEYSISLPDRDLYIAPLAKSQYSPVALSDTEFLWRIIGDYQRGFTIVRADESFNGLALTEGHGRLPPPLDTQYLRDGDEFQRWFFKRVGDVPETQSHCGPRRTQRGSFYHQ
ncbi:hypothetical protein B0O80DRAFT_503138 [Mortierella sp. GBAus27b]|nr:hypothetical protein BGX31_005397 [Mortierella sp. GBA43]KAI8346813.1 hypothetical protein B0O80DRAFT_503138 [Mortierella sp. GBAus27b]